MRKFTVILLFVLGIVLSFKVVASFAQENTDDKFSFGKVVNVSAQQITVKEYDFAKDADVEVSYDVTAETEFGNVNAVTDLAVNDDVVIDFTEKDGKRVVMTLVKEDKGAEAPAGTEALAADAPMANTPAPEMQ
ncbi:MAG: hypothetical protein V2A70_04980 [Candidatus Omnitrophota bacterium]